MEDSAVSDFHHPAHPTSHQLITTKNIQKVIKHKAGQMQKTGIERVRQHDTVPRTP